MGHCLIGSLLPPEPAPLLLLVNRHYRQYVLVGGGKEEPARDSAVECLAVAAVSAAWADAGQFEDGGAYGCVDRVS